MTAPHPIGKTTKRVKKDEVFELPVPSGASGTMMITVTAGEDLAANTSVSTDPFTGKMRAVILQASWVFSSEVMR